MGRSRPNLLDYYYFPTRQVSLSSFRPALAFVLGNGGEPRSTIGCRIHSFIYPSIRTLLIVQFNIAYHPLKVTLMIGRQLWSEFFSAGNWPMASAVAIVMLILLLIPILIFHKIERKELEGRIA